MTATMLFALCFLIGCVTGLRSMMGVALVCWAAHLGWLNLPGTKLSFLASVISLIVFSLLAVGELIADKLPKVPPRVQAGPLVVRVIFGALAASALAAAAGAALVPAMIFGAIGAIVGAYAGYAARKAIVKGLGIRDLPIALAEDAVAILVGLFAVSRF